jgi:hypothetical protein
MNEMQSRDRVMAAVALEAVDRVPVIPKAELFSLRHCGEKVATAIIDPERYRQTMEITYDDLGGFDAITIPGQFMNEMGFYPMGAASKLPGYQLGDDELFQMDEHEVMTVEDYDVIKEKGWAGYLKHVYPKLGYPFPAEEVPQRQQKLVDQKFADILVWEAKGVPLFMGPGYIPSFELISFSRSLKATLMDVRRHPDRLLEAIVAMEEEALNNAAAQIDDLRAKTKHSSIASMMSATRPAFLRPEYFDRFFWQFLKKAVQFFVDRGFVAYLHYDGNWDRYLQPLLELPAKSVIVDFDGSTDIFKAKDVLRGHMCIMGDVPAGLLALAGRDEVVEYCKKLIDVVGKDGGFILSSGCSIPLNAKPENVQAMIDTAKTYYPHA